MHLQMILKEIQIPKSVCLLAGMEFDILENDYMVYTVKTMALIDILSENISSKKKYFLYLSREYFREVKCNVKK